MATFFGIIAIAIGALMIAGGVSLKEGTLTGAGAMVCGGGALIGIGGNPAKDMPDGSPAMVVLGIVIIAAGFIMLWMKEKAGAEFAARLRPCMTYDSTKKEICVTKQGKVFFEALKIEEVTDYVQGYEPEKLHVGSATVGGVTTGGVYKTGGYSYIAGTKKTGKYALVYNEVYIHTIKLSPELAKKARRSGIKKYIDSSDVIKVIESSSAKLPDYAAGNMALTMHFAKEAVLAGYPTYEKCKEILDWLSQEEGQEQEEKQEQVEIATQSVSNNVGTPSVTPEEVAEMRRLYAELGSYAAVAKKMGRSSSTVAKYIKDRK